MANKVKITIDTDMTTGTLADSFSDASPNKSLALMRNFLLGIMGGQHAATVTTEVLNTGPEAKATGTITCSGNVEGDTLAIAGLAINPVDAREYTSITYVADIAGSLNDTYFTFSSAGDETNYYVWYNVDDAGTDPAVANATGIEVAIAADSTDVQVSNATDDAIGLIAGDDVIVSNSGSASNDFYNRLPGACSATAAGAADPGFTINSIVTGADLAADEFQVGDTNAETAAALCSFINADPTLSGMVTATVLNTTVTLTASARGAIGNAITLVESGNFTISGARLTGGVSDTPVVAEVTLAFGR